MAETNNILLARFRRKFVITNMLFAAIVLAVAFSTMWGASYNQHVEDVYEALETRINMTLERNQPGGMGGFGTGIGLGGDIGGAYGHGSQDQSNTGDPGQAQSSPEANGKPSPALTAPSPAEEDPAAPGKPATADSGKRGAKQQVASDQFVGTSLVQVNDDGTMRQSFGGAFELDTEDLEEALADVDRAVDDNPDHAAATQGSLSEMGLYYRAQPLMDGSTLVAFASSSYIDRNMVGLLHLLVISAIIALLAFLFISIGLAHWVARPVETAWDQQQQFIADASHELKTPLTVITANNSILLSQPDATIESQRQWIESTETETRSMQELVNDMLYLAKSSNAKVELTLSQVDLSTVVESQALQFESVAFERQIVMNADIAKDVVLQGDATRLQRLTDTLLDNACKYANDGGRVTVALSKTPSHCTLTVNNTGPAIDAEDLPHLFDRFYRSDKARTRASNSFGLGLSIAKSIVEEHKGSISVTSTEAEGTTFTVQLPIA